MHFVKMHGLGNDYIYVDEFLYPGPRDIAAAAPRASDRHTGIGGDGLVLIQPTDAADCRMRMFNADGSEGRMCGNAIRCIAYYMLVRHPERCKGDAVRIETLSGLRAVTAQRDAQGRILSLRADMDEPGFSAQSIPVLSEAPQDVDVPFRGGTKKGVCVCMGSPARGPLRGRGPDGAGPAGRRARGGVLRPLPQPRERGIRARARGREFADARLGARHGETMACGTAPAPRRSRRCTPGALPRGRRRSACGAATCSSSGTPKTTACT